MDTLRRLWAHVSDAAHAGVVTAVFTFLGLFGASLVGWLEAVTEWGAANEGQGAFPDVAVLGKAAVSAGAAALVGLLNYVTRALQSAGVLPGSGPSYPTSSGPPA